MSDIPGLDYVLCDICNDHATRVMTSDTTEWCASWFYGEYCDACFEAVEREMKLLVMSRDPESWSKEGF